MAENINVYKCDFCGKTINLDVGDDIPVCCGKEMVLELPKCRTVGAEMDKFNEADEPCDDGRADAG